MLFDLDGTLLDSEHLWDAAQQATMWYFGDEWTQADQAQGIGGPVERVVAYMAARTGAEPSDILRVLVTEIEHRVATQASHWLPGARELVTEVADAGVPMAIVSNSWRVILDLLVRRHDIPADVVVSSTDVSHPKPDPEPYVVACRALGADPGRAVVVEDSPTGVAAGLAAGCTVLAVSAGTAAVADHPRLVRRPDLRDARLADLQALILGS